MDDGSGDGGDDYPLYRFDTNQLWLQITNVSDGTVYANLYNATDQVYAVWSTTNLALPLADWQVETEVFPTDTNCMPCTVATLGRQDLFLQAEDWTGVDSDGDGVPDWWDWKYFGTINIVATNLDYSGDGHTFAQDYSSNTTPTVFYFSAIQVTNDHANVSSLPVSLDVAGFPYYIALAVDDTNYAADAFWNAYASSSLTAQFGLTEGWHDVAVGLRGHGDSAGDAAWQWKRVKLDLSPPILTVTNPVNGSGSAATVAQPIIQVQGFANKALSRITFDLGNAAGLVTNQAGYVTGQFYDTNLRELTTNYFQCYDVPLTVGLNTVAVHATDLAGNVMTTNANITLDYSTAATPVSTVIWPPDGTPIGGARFTLRAQVSDPTATVMATIVDAGGNTTSVAGTVDRSGLAQIPNLPMGGGVNRVTLTTTGASGLGSSTNFSVTGSDVGLTLDPLPTNHLNQPYVSVGGAIDSTNYSVTVNGVAATVSGSAWQADNVPVSPAGIVFSFIEHGIYGASTWPCKFTVKRGRTSAWQ